MKKLLLVALAICSLTIVAPVHAERIEQWVAPRECVTDYGLPSQVIMSQQDCYKHLNPSSGTTETPENMPGVRYPEQATDAHQQNTTTGGASPANLHQPDLTIKPPTKTMVIDSTDAQNIRSGFMILLLGMIWCVIVTTYYKSCSRLSMH